MKTKFLPLIVLSASLLIVACKKSTPTENKENESINTTSVDSTQNKWEGTYFGVLPCDSCPGINTLITLNADGTYEKNTEYLASDEKPNTSKGNFSWDETGTIITIEKESYAIEGTALYRLDDNYKKVEGEQANQYILNKTELQPSLDANEGYTLQTFIGSDNKKYNIIFNTNPTIPTAFVQTEGFNKMLSQTEAWAKGAEYSGHHVKLIAKGKVATLTVNNNKIELKQEE